MYPNAPITAAVLRWARSRRGLSLSQLQKTLNVSSGEIAAWERGEAPPPYAKAQRLATALRIPFGFLFLSAPPPDDIQLPDLRTREGTTPEKPSPELIEVVNDVIRRQEWYREYAEANGVPPLGFIRKFTMSAGPSVIAESIRDTLDITEGVRRRCDSWDSYLTRLVRNAESNGILVMRSGVVKHDTKRPLLVDEFQGFALCDDLAPVIFINTRDTKAARIFTFAHEAAHLWIGESGISIPSRLNENVGPSAKIELFCHAVAAETLVPRAELLESWQETGATIEQAQLLARHFWVSTIVVLRRAFELQLISPTNFYAAVEEARRREKPLKRGEGGNPYTTIPSRSSPKFTDSVLTALRERALLYTDAASLLALKQPMLQKLAKRRLGGQL